MESRHYFAAWTECGCLLGCEHKHRAVTEAVNCISQAGGYVVAMENGVCRALNSMEEAEFQHASRNARQKAILQYQPSGYAVMARVRVANEWTWTTWMRCETFEDAVARARPEDMVVRFGSARWNALLQTRESSLPAPEITSRDAPMPQLRGESLVEYVSRVVPSPRVAESTTASIRPFPMANESAWSTFVEFILEWIDNWERKLSEKVHFLRISVATLTLAVGNRARKTLQRYVPRSEE